MEPDNSPNLLGGRGDWLRKNDVEIMHIKFGVDERVLDNVKILIIYPKYDLCVYNNYMVSFRNIYICSGGRKRVFGECD